MRRKIRCCYYFGIATSLGLGGSAAVQAAGLSLRAQSAASIGTSGASDVSGTADISAMFSNPAALSAFRGNHVSIGAAYLAPTAKFENGERTVGSTGVNSVTDTADMKNNDSFAKKATVPAIFGAHEINENMTAGWSITVPWATSSDYGKDWVGRYHGSVTELNVTNIDGATSYKISDALKLGLGVQVQRGKGKIAGASNYGAAYNRAVAGAAAGVAGAYYTAAAAFQADPTNSTKAAAFQAASTAVQENALASQLKTAADAAISGKASSEVAGIVASTLAAGAGSYVIANEGRDDVYANYESDPSTGLGFTFGALYTPTEEWQLGFSYRSPVIHKTEGRYELSGETAVAETYAVGLGKERDAKLTVGIPDVIGFGATYKGLPDLDLFASASLTRWSRLRDLNVRPKDLPNVLVLLNWKDSWHMGVGAAYHMNQALTLRTGIAADKSPVPDALRSPRSPDADRTVMSLGTRYGADDWKVDFGVMHTKVKDPTLQLKDNDYPQANGRGNLTGSYKVSANTLMAQYEKSF